MRKLVLMLPALACACAHPSYQGNPSPAVEKQCQQEGLRAYYKVHPPIGAAFGLVGALLEPPVTKTEKDYIEDCMRAKGYEPNPDNKPTGL